MARTATVPTDMSSEQKTILGFISKRQLIYLIVGGAIIYAYVPYVYKLGPNFFVGIFMCLFSAIPVAAIVLILAFYKKQKLGMYFDLYLLIKFRYKHEIGIWRKGRQK